MVTLKKYQNKKIAIYGMGITGFSAARVFKRSKAKIYCWDDNKKVRKKAKSLNFNIERFWLNKNSIEKIIISPGIDINKCKLSKYLIKNKIKVITDLDIFYLNCPHIKKITITGTNGKSTTSKLLFDVLKAHKKDVRLAGNIGNPILSEIRIKNKTANIK